MTNDPAMPEVRLEVFGHVKPKVYLSSDVVRLTGRADQAIFQTVSITPTPENPFKILEITIGKGDFIRYDIKEIKQADNTAYALTIFNTKQEKGWYVDHLLIKTDSPLSPELKIRVLGLVRDD
jgi:hypothetical protein